MKRILSMITSLVLSVIIVLIPNFVLADGIIYLGIGKAKTASASGNGETPFSVGSIKLNDYGTHFGFDLAGEGTLLDSTYGRDRVPMRGNSFSVIAGKNLSKSLTMRFDLLALLGLRVVERYCPSSYVGNRCYANSELEVRHEFNVGLIAMYSFDKLSLGARITNASSQFLFGIKF